MWEAAAGSISREDHGGRGPQGWWDQFPVGARLYVSPTPDSTHTLEHMYVTLREDPGEPPPGRSRKAMQIALLLEPYKFLPHANLYCTVSTFQQRRPTPTRRLHRQRDGQPILTYQYSIPSGRSARRMCTFDYAARQSAERVCVTVWICF